MFTLPFEMHTVKTAVILCCILYIFVITDVQGGMVNSKDIIQMY